VLFGIAQLYLAHRLHLLRQFDEKLKEREAEAERTHRPELKIIADVYDLVNSLVIKTNTDIKTNRCVLYLAALSFFLAAAISFVLSLVR
jgi:hypothetical protein